MNILHLSFSRYGGAGIAASRLNESLKQLGIDSQFIYFRPYSPKTARISLIEKKVNGLQNILLMRLIGSRSLNVFPTSLLSKIWRSEADVVHLHWINSEMIAIEQIPKINKPVIWTFHDMWPFCGSEHYVEDLYFLQRYSRLKSAQDATIFDLNRWVFERKKKAWKEFYFHIVCPSTWLAKCVKESSLFGEQPVTVIPNCLDLDVYRPIDQKKRLRAEYGVPVNKKVILFGAYNPHQHIKGGDLLHEALWQLNNASQYLLLVFGTKTPIISLCNLKSEVQILGSYEDDNELAKIYNLADVVCVPSRQESFGQTASEPLACGVPVVAFNTTGLKEVVDHKVNGYLASAFDTCDFARGIEWVLNEGGAELSINARKKAEQSFAPFSVARKYLSVYKKALAIDY